MAKQSARFFGILLLLVSSVSYSKPFAVIPDCLDDARKILPINNQEVIHAISNTPNAYEMRGHIKGVVGIVYDDRNGHDHFEAVIGTGAKEKIEVVYNQGFGNLPNLKPGMTVEACGDYITSNQQTGPYPASPNGAIIHYLHFARNRHASGFLVIDGIVYGYGNRNGNNNSAPDFFDSANLSQ